MVQYWISFDCASTREKICCDANVGKRREDVYPRKAAAFRCEREGIGEFHFFTMERASRPQHSSTFYVWNLVHIPKT